MFGKIVSQLTVYALRHKRLSGEQKAYVASALLDNLEAPPIADIITITADGTMLIRGRRLSVEQAIAFKESGASLKKSFALKLIHDQIKFLAINIGIHQGLTQDGITFSKASLWVVQEVEKLVNQFSGELSTFDETDD